MAGTRTPTSVWVLLAATVVASFVFAPLALVLAVAGYFHARAVGAPRGVMAAFLVLAVLNLLLLVLVGLSLTVSGGSDSGSS
jgi:hypothetical protein